VRSDYQSLAYLMRRPTGCTTAQLTPFYSDVVGLPLVRDHDPAMLFWAGEDLIFEIKVDDAPGFEATDPATAACLPVFRSHDLDVTLQRLAAAGYPPVALEDEAHGRTAWILGPDRLLTGFSERSADSPLAADAEALRRWRSGPVPLRGVAPLAPDLQYMSRIVRRVADVDAVVAFHRDVLGLDVVATEGDSVLLDLGDTVLMQVSPGGSARSLPADRAELPDTIITRVHGFGGFVDDLTTAGAPWIGERVRYFTGTELAYTADPEGWVVGFEDRTSWGDFVEDLEAERRWELLVASGTKKTGPGAASLPDTEVPA
jgi:catechol-2,3-dioxygenase